jgi:hypothetical protein
MIIGSIKNYRLLLRDGLTTRKRIRVAAFFDKNQDYLKSVGYHGPFDELYSIIYWSTVFRESYFIVNLFSPAINLAQLLMMFHYSFW